MTAHHVYPLNDLREHVTDDSAECWCKPEHEIVPPAGEVIVHHSMDGREKFETGERKPS